MPHLLKLDNRSVIQLSGPDADNLLQGLITNDISELEAGHAMYGALLTPQGKFLFDMIIVREGDNLLLDIEAAGKADLTRRLMMYRLRADVEIIDDERNVWALFDGSADSGISYTDPRHKSLHQRVISAENPAPNADALPFEKYEERRIRHGVPDGSRDMMAEKYFWLETDAERLNGVSFTKGCFVGQELTARMKHRTSLKKRLVAIKSANETPLESGAKIMTEAGKNAGGVHTCSGVFGIAFLRLEYAEQPLFANGVPIQINDKRLQSGE